MTILSRLKAETRSHHDDVEGAVTILRPDATAADYHRYLAQLWGIHAPLERALAAAAPVVTDMHARWKAPLLHEDLTAFDHDPAQLPQCDALPALDSPARRFGCLYVLEGSTLGGQLILKALTARMPEAIGKGSSFLRAYGPRVGDMWKRFGAALEAYVADAPAADQPRRSDDVVAGARDTFVAFKKWLAP